MEQYLQFGNLFDDEDDSFNKSIEFMTNDDLPNSNFETPILVHLMNSGRIDEECFQIPPVYLPKNAEIYFEDFDRIEEQQFSVRKNSITSLEEPVILTDFKVS